MLLGFAARNMYRTLRAGDDRFLFEFFRWSVPAYPFCSADDRVDEQCNQTKQDNAYQDHGLLLKGAKMSAILA